MPTFQKLNFVKKSRGCIKTSQADVVDAAPEIIYIDIDFVIVIRICW